MSLQTVIGVSRERPQKRSAFITSCFLFQGSKKEPKPNRFGPDIFGWGGGLPREGLGTKKFGMSLETQGNQTFGRDIPGFLPGYPRGARKVSGNFGSYY